MRGFVVPLQVMVNPSLMAAVLESVFVVVDKGLEKQRFYIYDIEKSSLMYDDTKRKPSHFRVSNIQYTLECGISGRCENNRGLENVLKNYNKGIGTNGGWKI